MNVENIEKTSVTYWLNQLQNLKIEKDIFLSINPFREISASKIFKKVRFSLILFIAGVTVFAFYPVLKSYGGVPVPEGAPLFIQNMIYKHDVGYGAVFTIFPHMGYILFGACIGALLRENSQHIKKIWFPAVLIGGGIIVIILIKKIQFFLHRTL